MRVRLQNSVRFFASHLWPATALITSVSAHQFQARTSPLPPSEPPYIRLHRPAPSPYPATLLNLPHFYLTLKLCLKRATNALVLHPPHARDQVRTPAVPSDPPYPGHPPLRNCTSILIIITRLQSVLLWVDRIHNPHASHHPPPSLPHLPPLHPLPSLLPQARRPLPPPLQPLWQQVPKIPLPFLNPTPPMHR